MFHLQLSDDYEAQERDIEASKAFRPQPRKPQPKRWVIAQYVLFVGVAFIVTGVMLLGMACSGQG